MFVGAPKDSFPNNGLVSTTNGHDEFHLRFFCRSNSTRINTGTLIGLDGNNITTADPFYISNPQPGELQIIVYRNTTLNNTDQGIYTCQIPLENGQPKNINIGIYSDGFRGKQFANHD